MGAVDDATKRRAAEAGFAFLAPGMRVGLGTGSTASVFVRLLGERVRQGLDIVGVPTSERTRELAGQCGIPLSTLELTPVLDVTVDGADAFDAELNLIKGGGGALLGEKVVAAASARLVILADHRKRVSTLAEVPLPVEVVPFAWRPVADRLAALGGRPTIRSDPTGARYLTDQGNYIMDCVFGTLPDPAALDQRLNAIPGVVEHGLFVDMASVVLMGSPAGVEVFERRR